jgi:hypothetical protein
MKKNQSETPKFMSKFEFQMPQNCLIGLMESIDKIAELDSTWEVKNYLLMVAEEVGGSFVY